ncbi:TPA: N-acetyl-gamma-glutamyl-phosphate reductase [Candidatus Poribacteria bacterium]|nr:N-acetyl-gamma-glutamyl-phosphate reductase [Candidatus Poribacteria bacterium]
MLKIGIVGASGYTSSELMRLLVKHTEEIKIELATSETYTGRAVTDVLPNLRGLIELEFSKLKVEELKDRVDIVFLAVPHTVAMSFAPGILEQGVRVIDFSADYRLKDAKVYEAWYHVEHTSSGLISEAVYGLPELHREEIRKAKLIANPGCYPTGVILASLPLLHEELVDLDGIVIDAKSGISGAGSKPSDTTHFPNREGNIVAYKIGVHQHTPEIEQELSQFAGREITVNFTPHLMPMSRGILSTLYFTLKKDISTDGLLDIYNKFYEREPFVRVLNKGEYPQTKAVYGSNYCDVGLEVDARTKRVVVMSALDNLVKGASGAALQNMNLIAGFEETAGLDFPPLMP